MKQILILIFLLIVGFQQTFSQETVNRENAKSDNVKSESLKGLELRIIPYSNGMFYNQVGLFEVRPFSLSVYLGFLNEKRIASGWTLLLNAGLHNVAFQRPVYRPNSHSGYMSVGPDTRTNYSLLLEAGVEPRYYINGKEQSKNKESQMISGWFLSTPLLFKTTILHTPEPSIHLGWLPNSIYSGSFLLTPTVGYRHALSGHLFMEGSIGFGANLTVCLNSVDNRVTVLNPEFNPVFKLNAVYKLN